MKPEIFKCFNTLLFYLFLINNCLATGEIGAIRGSVSSKNSGKPIANASIILIQKNKEMLTVKSNNDGTFHLPQIVAGNYDLVCSYTGFVKQRIVGLSIREDNTKLAFFKLSTSPKDSPEDAEELIMTHASLQVIRERANAASSKTETTLADLPATMYVYTQQDIADRGYVHLSELLADLPQVEVNERSSATDYNIVSSRGIVGNEKMLVLINGVRANSMARTSHALDKAYSIRYAEKIEVILGPSSSTYSSDAFMGVINIIMPKGQDNKGIALNTSYGMYNTTENAFFLSYGKKIGVSLSGHLSRSDDPVMPQHYGSDFNWYNNVYQNSGAVLNNVFGNDTTQLPILPYATPQMSYSGQLRLDMDDFEFGLSYHAQTFSSATASNSQYAIASKDNENGFGMGNAYLKHKFKSKTSEKQKNFWTLESLVNWNSYSLKKHGTSQNVYTMYKKAYRAAVDNNIQIKESFNYNLLSPKNFKHQFAATATGLYTFAVPITSYSENPFNTSRNRSAIDQDIYYIGSDYIDEDDNSLKFIQNVYQTNQLNFNGFAQYGFKYKDILSFTLATNLNLLFAFTPEAEKKSLSFFNLTPKATLVVKINDHFRIKAFYAQAALAPSLRRRYEHYGTLEPQESTSGSYLVGQAWRIPSGSNLAPEKIQTAELDLSYTKGNLLLISNVFFSYSENAISDYHYYNKSFINNSITAASAVQANNGAEAYLYGGSFFASYELTAGKIDQFNFKVDGSYSYMSGRIDGLEHIPYTAKHTIKGGLFLRYKFASLSTRLVYRSASFNEGYEDEDGNFTQFANEAYISLNLFAKCIIYENKKSGLGIDVFLKINNLTNNRYYHITDNNPISTGAAPQSPLLVMGGVNFRFLR